MASERTTIEPPKGFQRTEVGMIPRDWSVHALGELFSFSGGLSASRDQLSEDGICYLHYGDIHGSAKTYIDVKAEFSSIPKLNVGLGTVPRKSLLSDGDVVFVDASEDDEGTSKHVVVRNSDSVPYISGLHTIVSKSKDDSLDSRYKEYCFQTADIKRQFKFYAVGTKVSGISKTNIAKVFIPRPPKPEQRAIAASLSEVDALIVSLEKLLAKKRAIKQGAMQELLTGKRRLSGFSEKWVLKKLGSLCSRITTGKLDANAMVDDGEYRFYTCAKDYYAIDTYAFDDEALLVSGNGENVGYVHYYKGKFNAYQRTYVMTGFSADIIFVKLLLDAFLKNRIAVEVNAGNTPYIKMGTLTEMDLFIPQHREEQSAIAKVLSEMTLEIEALECRLLKYRSLQQGAMQVLLTGKVRLV